MFGRFYKGEEMKLYHQLLISPIHHLLIVSVKHREATMFKGKILSVGLNLCFKLQLCYLVCGFSTPALNSPAKSNHEA